VDVTYSYSGRPRVDGMRNERMAKTTCTATGKRRYRSYWDARAAANTIRHQTGESHGRPYGCHECHGWHLGNSTFQFR
jgi:hypothetical protein